tara:strand:+ start:3607 stop:4566 length:960 start_codon:yes stop_codon:yes gene_type:complete
VNELISLDSRIGVDISKARTYKEVVDLANINFSLDIKNIKDEDGYEIPDFFSVRREDTKETLGIVKSKYRPVPIDSMLEPFHEMVEKYDATYETAGVIGNGKKVFVIAKMPHTITVSDRKGDILSNRIVCLIANDGTKRNAYFTIAQRICCLNQFSLMAISASRSNEQVTHVKNWNKLLQQAQNSFQLSIDMFNEFGITARALESQHFGEDQMRSLLNRIFPDPKEKKKRKTARLINRREKVFDLYQNGTGNVGSTKWDAFNAVTEYLDHYNNTTRLKSANEVVSRAAAERRLSSSLLGGWDDKIKKETLKFLLHCESM